MRCGLWQQFALRPLLPNGRYLFGCDRFRKIDETVYCDCCQVRHPIGIAFAMAGEERRSLGYFEVCPVAQT